jgi:hypothetical protein
MYRVDRIADFRFRLKVSGTIDGFIVKGLLSYTSAGPIIRAAKPTPNAKHAGIDGWVKYRVE